MEYRELRYVDKPVSKMVFGCANTAMIQGKRVDRLLNAALAAGINTFDMAEAYGASEELSLIHIFSTRSFPVLET